MKCSLGCRSFFVVVFLYELLFCILADQVLHENLSAKINAVPEMETVQTHKGANIRSAKSTIDAQNLKANHFNLLAIIDGQIIGQALGTMHKLPQSFFQGSITHSLISASLREIKATTEICVKDDLISEIQDFSTIFKHAKYFVMVCGTKLNIPKVSLKLQESFDHDLKDKALLLNIQDFNNLALNDENVFNTEIPKIEPWTRISQRFQLLDILTNFKWEKRQAVIDVIENVLKEWLSKKTKLNGTILADVVQLLQYVNSQLLPLIKSNIQEIAQQLKLTENEKSYLSENFHKTSFLAYRLSHLMSFVRAAQINMHLDFQEEFEFMAAQLESIFKSQQDNYKISKSFEVYSLFVEALGNPVLSLTTLQNMTNKKDMQFITSLSVTPTENSCNNDNHICFEVFSPITNTLAQPLFFEKAKLIIVDDVKKDLMLTPSSFQVNGGESVILTISKKTVPSASVISALHLTFIGGITTLLPIIAPNSKDNQYFDASFKLASSKLFVDGKKQALSDTVKIHDISEMVIETKLVEVNWEKMKSQIKTDLSPTFPHGIKASFVGVLIVQKSESAPITSHKELLLTADPTISFIPSFSRQINHSVFKNFFVTSDSIFEIYHVMSNTTFQNRNLIQKVKFEAKAVPLSSQSDLIKIVLPSNETFFIEKKHQFWYPRPIIIHKFGPTVIKNNTMLVIIVSILILTSSFLISSKGITKYCNYMDLKWTWKHLPFSILVLSIAILLVVYWVQLNMLTLLKILLTIFPVAYGIQILTFLDFSESPALEKNTKIA